MKKGRTIIVELKFLISLAAGERLCEDKRLLERSELTNKREKREETEGRRKDEKKIRSRREKIGGRRKALWWRKTCSGITPKGNSCPRKGSHSVVNDKRKVYFQDKVQIVDFGNKRMRE